MHVQPSVRALVGKTPVGPHDFPELFSSHAHVALAILDRFVMWIFCRVTIAVLAEKKSVTSH